MPRIRKHRRDFPGKRPLILALRTAHLIGVVLFASALFAAGDVRPPGALVFLSGAALFAVDLYSHPTHWRELAGATIIVKLALVGLALLQPELAVPVFWTLLVLSSVMSHAPGSLRHIDIFGRQPEAAGEDERPAPPQL